MLKDASRPRSVAAVSITATAFRDDRSAVLVTITDLAFDRCRISSATTFRVGERLRLHLCGQGWFEADVQSSSADGAEVSFLTRSRC